MPAKPGLRLRLTTMTVLARSTSRMGIPAMGLFLFWRASGLTTSLAPMTMATSTWPNDGGIVNLNQIHADGNSIQGTSSFLTIAGSGLLTKTGNFETVIQTQYIDTTHDTDNRTNQHTPYAPGRVMHRKPSYTIRQKEVTANLRKSLV